MGPAELAALVAREADAGVASALGALDAAGVLVAHTVIARVASVPEGGTEPEDLPQIVWQAEVVMHPDPDRRRPGAGTPGLSVPGALAALPVRALRGVGPAWAESLAASGLETVGDLATAAPAAVAALVGDHGVYAAELAGRARTIAAPWPDLPEEAGSWGSVLAVASGDPGLLSGDPVLAHAVWGRCLALVAAVDADVLADLPVTGLGAQER